MIFKIENVVGLQQPAGRGYMLSIAKSPQSLAVGVPFIESPLG